MTNPNGDGWGSRWPYNVGYGKPPKHTQFRKGHSGNRSGRPKRRRGNAEYLQEALDKPVRVMVDNVPKMMPRQKVMFEILAVKAAKGEIRSIKVLQDFMKDIGTTGGAYTHNEMKITFVKPEPKKGDSNVRSFPKLATQKD